MSHSKRPLEPCAEMLSGIDLFSHLNNTQRQEIAGLCDCHHFQSGQEIISHGSTSKDVYFVISGQVQAIIFSSTGKQLVLNNIGPGALFGELSAIDNQPRSAFVFALNDAAICSLSASDFWFVLRQYPPVNTALMLRLSQRIRQLCGRMIEISMLPVKSRIHAEILRLALQYPTKNNQVVINFAPTHMEIASHIGTHREAVSRELAQLKAHDIIARANNNTLIIKDLKRLQELVRQVSDMPVPWLEAS